MLDFVYVIFFKIFVLLVKFTPRFIMDAILNFFTFLVYKLDSRHRK